MFWFVFPFKFNYLFNYLKVFNDDRLAITDFGLSKTNLTVTASIHKKGTWNWMAPG